MLNGFSLSALKVISNYLTNRKQRTRINNSYSSWKDILLRVPQGSILDPILLSIFLSDLFLLIDDIDFTSYADDNTTYCGCDSTDDAILSSQDSAEKDF